MKTFREKGVEPSIITEPLVPAVPGMPTAEEVWEELSRGYLAPQFREWAVEAPRTYFTEGLKFVVDLVTPDAAQAFADERAFQGYLDQMELHMPSLVTEEWGAELDVTAGPTTTIQEQNIYISSPDPDRAGQDVIRELKRRGYLP